jgi:anti-sigma regulatory factor (Ser/Thr protein kinase)
MHGHGGAPMSHAALLYSSPGDAMRRLVPLIEDDLHHGRAVLVCLDDAKADPLASALGASASEITFVPATARYTRPAVAVEMLSAFLARATADGASGTHSIGELTLDGGERDADWLRYEAAVNDIFATAPLRATCLYPGDLPPALLSSVACTHPLLDASDGVAPSRDYQGAAEGARRIVPVPLPPTRLPDLAIGDITEARRARVAVLDAVGELPERTTFSDDLALVVSELVTNGLLHGGTATSLAVWLESTSVVVQVCDDGPGIDDAFIGLRPPSLPSRGAGLWVAHLLADRITIERGPTGGACVTVRLVRPA